METKNGILSSGLITELTKRLRRSTLRNREFSNPGDSERRKG
jgi:hypothetical protein